MPIYEPEYWNDPERKDHNNCYNYATDSENVDYKGPLSQAYPGYGGYKYSGGSKPKDYEDCADLTTEAKRDGLTVSQEQDIDELKNLGAGRWYVACYRRVEGQGFHWVRQDNQKTQQFPPSSVWSHKPGDKKVTQKDSEGKDIVDPANATIEGYVFCSYMICDTKTHIKGIYGDEYAQLREDAHV